MKQNHYILVSELFLRLLALVYLAAFASLAFQIEALAGSEGILPLADGLRAAEQGFGWQRFIAFPSIFWLYAGDAALLGAAVLGVLLALLPLFGVWRRTALLLMFALYLSLFHAGQIFMNFQWDYLLLEAGFLAIFLAPGSRWVIWLYRWLLFRLRFLSGISKIVSQDPGWAGLTALGTYFETQPLPHIGGWYAHQLPEGLLRGATGAVLVVEILVPFMMFLPRRPRFVAAWLTILFQVLIILTSNHNWFNFLTIALCLFLFDDKAVGRVLPHRLSSHLLGSHKGFLRPVSLTRLVPALVTFVLILSGVQMWEMISGKELAGTAGHLKGYAQQWHVVNKYHVFPTMKTQRIELIIEGSLDGREWREYPFRYKPDGTDKPLAIVLPHHPRVDWMMWFVPMSPMFMPWFEGFLYALMDNSAPVVALLKDNPFADKAPNFIRVTAYRYRFTSMQEHRQDGEWWRREAMGPFTPLPWLDGSGRARSLSDSG